MAYRDDFWRGEYGRDFERYGHIPSDAPGWRPYNDWYPGSRFFSGNLGPAFGDQGPETYPRESRWSMNRGIRRDYDAEFGRPHDGMSRSPGYGRGEFPLWGSNAYDTGDGERFGRTARHAGRGPKGYRRSDERIREDINDRLTMHPEIDASDVEVTVAAGIVTLAGIVEDRGDKRIAEDIAESVAGVDDVVNQLKVKRGLLAALTGEKADEREIARSQSRESTTSSSTRAANRTTAGSGASN